MSADGSNKEMRAEVKELRVAQGMIVASRQTAVA